MILLFRRLVFVQVLLGIMSFCMAEQNPELLLMAGALAAMSWYVAEGPTGRPLPQWVILPAAMAAVAWLFVELWWSRSQVDTDQLVRAMGHFTIWLQVIQLYAPKANRDYALILVLSLLQMVGACVLSVALVFGGLLAVYCVLSLFTVLLFQLKLTSDHVLLLTQRSAPPGTTVERSKAVMGRGVTGHFRWTAATLGLVCGGVALVFFLLWPRSSRLEVNPGAVDTGMRQVGFSSQVQLGVATGLSSSNRTPVLNMQVWREDRKVGDHGQIWRLRGAVLDHYEPTTKTWGRGRWVQSRDVSATLPPSGLELGTHPAGQPIWQADLSMRQSSMPNLFTLFPTTLVQGANFRTLTVNFIDQQMVLSGHETKAAAYRTIWVQDRQAGGPRTANVIQEEADKTDHTDYARRWPVHRVQMRRLVEQVLARAGLQRDPDALSTPQDEQVAIALTQFLQQPPFVYSTQPSSLAVAGDPILHFLTQGRQGHCEVFASALVALARSAGLRARVVTGYLAHEYNGLGGYYVVRQSDAHAWTEIECGSRGWLTFDPTPTQSLPTSAQGLPRWLYWFNQAYEHLEYTWLSTVVAYDKETRQAVLGGMGQSFRQATQGQNTWSARAIGWIKQQIQDWRFDLPGSILLGVSLTGILLALATLLRILIKRRRRIVALQLTRLPTKQRRQLARRLGFYLTMLDMLDRHGYYRPAWQSPFGFAKELTESNPMRFGPVLTLTEHFYEIRFGHRDLDPIRKKTIKAHLSQLEYNLGQRDVSPQAPGILHQRVN